MDDFLDAIQSIAVQHALSSVAQAQFNSGDIARAELEAAARAIEFISARYNDVKRDRVAPFSDSNLAKGYALYFGIINAAKFSFLLQQLPASFAERKLKVLDFGCGTASGSLAVFDRFSDAHITGMDHSVAMLETAQKLTSALVSSQSKSGVFEVRQGSDIPAEEYDLILFGNVINEMSAEQALAQTQKAFSSLKNLRKTIHLRYQNAPISLTF